LIRIGVLVPSSNTVLEPELARLAGGVSLHFSRVRVTRIGADTEAAAQFDTAAMVAAAELLADAGVDVIVWGGTAGSWLGVPHDLSIVSAIEAATGVLATTSTLALLDAARAFGVLRTALVTPYVAEVVSEIVSCYAGSGLEVSGGEHLGLSDNQSFGSVPAGTLRPMIAWADAPVMVVCTNLRAATVVDSVETSGGPLVLDSVVATLWGALRLAGVTVSLPGGGALLRSGALRADLQSLCAGCSQRPQQTGSPYGWMCRSRGCTSTSRRPRRLGPGCDGSSRTRAWTSGHSTPCAGWRPTGSSSYSRGSGRIPARPRC
jgi:maleate isomerase